MARKTNPAPSDSKPCTWERGLAAEARARAYLAGLGYSPVENNFRARGGELDLILLDGRQVVFVEVRSAWRRSDWLRYTISPAKSRRLVRTAAYYFLARPWARRCSYRFDLVWVEGATIEHWKNVLLG